MKAIGAKQAFHLSEGNHFYQFEKEIPEPKQRELLVNIQAISVNPVDTKIRQTQPVNSSRILGFDAVGVVEKVGAAVTMFQPGDRVYYSGSPQYPGSNQAYQLVDERLVARAPKNLSDVEAASLPLTALTASETLFEVFNISKEPKLNKDKSLLIINGAGGVGSIATQIAKHYGLKVITTASRSETREWSESMGADVVLNHRNQLKDEFERYGIDAVDYIFCTFDTDEYYKQMIDLVKVRGKIATIVAFKEAQDLNLLKEKSITFTHEYMYARTLNESSDMIQHHLYLNEVTEKVEAGYYRPTMTKVIQGLTSEHLYQAHQALERQSMIGKLVIDMATASK